MKVYVGVWEWAEEKSGFSYDSIHFRTLWCTSIGVRVQKCGFSIVLHIQVNLVGIIMIEEMRGKGGFFPVTFRFDPVKFATKLM